MSKWRFPQYTTMTFIAMLLLAGCVSQQKYSALDTEYQQLNQTMSKEVAANQMQITRLQNAIKVTVNSELLFPSGGWQMSGEAQQTIGKIIPILAPNQKSKINVNGYTDNVPIGPGLMKIEYLKMQIVTVVTIALAGFFLLLASKWLWRPGSAR